MSENEQTPPVAIGEIEQGPSKFEQFLDKNQKNLVIAGIAIAVIVAGFIIIKGIKENKLLNASSALVGSEDAASLQDTANKFAGTPAGGSALIALADMQWGEDKKDDSIDTLKSFLNEYADHPAYGSALVSLASKLSKNGQVEEAQSHLQQAINLDDPTFTPLAELLCAEQELKSGNKEEALAIYNELDSLSKEDLGSLGELVKSRIITAKSPTPQEVEPESAKK